MGLMPPKDRDLSCQSRKGRQDSGATFIATIEAGGGRIRRLATRIADEFSMLTGFDLEVFVRPGFDRLGRSVATQDQYCVTGHDLLHSHHHPAVLPQSGVPQ